MLLAARSINGLIKTPFQNTISQTVGLIITSGKDFFFLLNQTLSILQPVSNCSLMELMGKFLPKISLKSNQTKLTVNTKGKTSKRTPYHYLSGLTH